MNLKSNNGAINYEKYKFAILGVVVALIIGGIAIVQLLEARRVTTCEDVEKSISNVAVAQTTYFEDFKNYAPDIETLKEKSSYAPFMKIADGVTVEITSITMKTKRTLLNKNPTEAAYTAEAYHPVCTDESGSLKLYRFDTTKDGFYE